jgi:putative spermidine/putrescine transport system substrate-binding protein/spermidine/putrescine transport system substrate-binding protein
MRNSSRRLRRGAGGLAVLAAAFAVVACGADTSPSANSGGDGSSAKGNEKCASLNLLTWEGYAEPDVVKPFETEHGVKVNATYVGSDAELVSKAAVEKGRYQVINVGSATRQREKDSGSIIALDTSRLENYANIYDFLKPAYELDGKTYGIADAWAVNPFLWNTDKIKEAPDNLEDAMWDPRLKGRLALWNEVSLIYLGASVLGIPSEHPDATAEGGVFNLTDEQLEQVKDKMITLKPQVRAMWETGGDLIQLFANGEVDGSPGWNYMYQQLTAKKFPIGQKPMGDAGAAWIDGLGIGAGNSKACEDLAYDWINWVTSPENQAALAKATGYGVGNQQAKEHMDADLISSTMMTDPDTLMKDAIFRLDPARPDAYQRVVEEIVAGLK